MEGWVKIHRSIFEHWVWEEPASRGQAWVDLVLMVNHKKNKALVNGHLVTVNRGEHITSYKKLAKRWGWGERTVRTFLNTLEKDGMIARESTHAGTRIKLVNYDYYQSKATSEETSGRHAEDTLVTTNKNEENDENEDKGYKERQSSPQGFIKFLAHYPRQEGLEDAQRNWNFRLRDGYSAEEMIYAAYHYSIETYGRNEEYIKKPGNFLGPDLFFIDWVKCDSVQFRCSCQTG